MSFERAGLISVRLAETRDYAAITDLHNADNEPHFQASSAQLQKSDATNLNGGRIVALQDGAVIGTAAFWLWTEVDAYRIGIHNAHQASGADAATQMMLISSAAPPTPSACSPRFAVTFSATLSTYRLGVQRSVSLVRGESRADEL